MLTGDQEGSSMFFKRGNRVYRKKSSKGKTTRGHSPKSNIQIRQKEKKDSVPIKRTEIAEKLDQESSPIHLHKSNWHSHGRTRPISSLSKKSFSSENDLSAIAGYLEKLELPKSQWKAGARSLIDNAKKMLKMTAKFPEKPETNEGVIQSLVQPSEVVESSRGNGIISTLLRDIANEVAEDTTPLDEYLNSVSLGRRKAQRNVVTKRPVRRGD